MNIHIHHHFHNDLEEKLLLIIKTQKKIMDSNEELNSKLDTLQTTVDDVQQKLIVAEAAEQTALAAKDKAIADLTAANEALVTAKTALQAELTNSVSPAQTQAAITKIDALTADVLSTPAV